MGLAPNRLYQMDCLDGMARVHRGSVDLVFADPPFNIGYDYDVYDDNRGEQEYLEWSRRWIDGVWKALKPEGTFWLAIGDEYAAELKLIAQEAGFHCRSWVIWYYTFGVNCKQGFSRSHTHLFHFVKDPDNFTFNAANPANRVPSARQLVYADLRANPDGRLPDNTWILRPQDIPDSFREDEDVWYYSRVAGTFKEREGFHGCQMPEQLLGRIIRSCSLSGDLVMDPFGGSGTTLVVAKKLQRRWLGFELSEEYATRIRQRLEGAQGGDALDGPFDPVRSAPSTKKGKQRPTQRILLESELLEIYEQVNGGHSVDTLLCDPERGAAFVEAGQERKLTGVVATWYTTLLDLERQGKLPEGSSDSAPPADAMSPYSHAAEIAMQLAEVEFSAPFRQILGHPLMSKWFDEAARRLAPGREASDYRWAAMEIRRRAKQVLEAEADESHLVGEALPEPMPLERLLDEPAEFGRGVYLLFDEESTCLYVGEAEEITARLSAIRGDAFWDAYKPATCSLIPVPAGQSTVAVQRLLVARFRPLLNWRHLAASATAAVALAR